MYITVYYSIYGSSIPSVVPHFVKILWTIIYVASPTAHQWTNCHYFQQQNNPRHTPTLSETHQKYCKLMVYHFSYYIWSFWDLSTHDTYWENCDVVLILPFWIFFLTELPVRATLTWCWIPRDRHWLGSWWVPSVRRVAAFSIFY